MDEHQDQSKQPHLVSKKSRVIVFDIDNTLCRSLIEEEELIKEIHPDCPIIEWDMRKHVFLPHLQILFDYLLKHGARVAFFSAGPKERNELVINALLTSFYGAEKYEELRAKGQFNIHSEDDLRESNFSRKGEGNYVKDLKAVIRDRESLSDIILVDDDPSYVAYDQHPFMFPLDLMYWYFSNSKEYFYKNPKNSVYYMLGIFKTAFEDEKYRTLRLKEAFRRIVPEKYYPTEATDSFKRNMIDLGLSEVQKEIPEAKLFGTSSSDSD